MTRLEYDRTPVWHPYASLRNPSPVREVATASGVTLRLADGTRLVDAVSSWWCVAHGHSHPHIVEAMRRQAERLSHVMFGGLTHAPAIELAERLAGIAPPGLDRVFFADSGSIAVEVAVKMAIQYQQAKGRPRRCKMLALKGGYHGDTACAMALSDPDGMHVLFRGMMPRHHFAEKPSVELSGTGVARAPRTDESRLAEEIAAMERLCDRHRGELAGIVCEPVFQAANAMNFYDPRYLAALRRLCDAHDLVLVFDEIAAGFFRTGPCWAHARAGAAPDVMTVGKALTGGHVTLAATLVNARVADTISNGTIGAFMHGPTYMANPIACAAACASLDLFAASDYESKVREIEAGLGAALAPARGLPNVRDVRVLGAAGVIEVDRLRGGLRLARPVRRLRLRVEGPGDRGRPQGGTRACARAAERARCPRPRRGRSHRGRTPAGARRHRPRHRRARRLAAPVCQFHLCNAAARVGRGYGRAHRRGAGRAGVRAGRARADGRLP